MPLPPAVRGLRRAELASPDPLAAARFLQDLLGWRIWESGGGFDCWVGDRRCAVLRRTGPGTPTGWRPVFAGAAQECELVGPDEAAAQLVAGRAQHGPWAPAPRAGEPRWAELRAADPARADEFWTATLGCAVRDGVYSLRGRAFAGRGERPPEGRWGWLCHFAAAEFTAAAGRVVELGGKVLEQGEHPVLGEALVLADPTGGICGLAPATGRWG